MPVYEYRCSRCDSVFEHFCEAGEPEPRTSPCCQAPISRELSVPAAHRGRFSRPASGQTCCGLDERCDAPPCAVGGACRHDAG